MEREFLSLHDTLHDAAPNVSLGVSLHQLARYATLEGLIRRGGGFPEALILKHVRKTHPPRPQHGAHRTALRLLVSPSGVAFKLQGMPPLRLERG